MTALSAFRTANPTLTVIRQMNQHPKASMPYMGQLTPYPLWQTSSLGTPAGSCILTLPLLPPDRNRVPDLRILIYRIQVPRVRKTRIR